MSTVTTFNMPCPNSIEKYNFFFFFYSKFSYTLSIFVAEAAAGVNETMTTRDAVRLLRVEDNTMLFQRLTEKRGQTGTATIVRLLDHIKRTQGVGSRSSSCQTESTAERPASERLYERLAELEYR